MVLPTELRIWREPHASPSKGAFAGRVREHWCMHPTRCFRKVSLAAVRDELVREGTKAKVRGPLLCPQRCAGGFGAREESKQASPPALQGCEKETLPFLL